MNANQIMVELMKVSWRTSLKFRDTFYRDNQNDSRIWYVELGPVVLSSLEVNSWSNDIALEGGPTSGAALMAMWNAVKKMSLDPNKFFLLYSCPPDAVIPGDMPQAWVRRNLTGDCWEDVEPTEKALRIHGIPRDRLVSYKHHLFQFRR